MRNRIELAIANLPVPQKNKLRWLLKIHGRAVSQGKIFPIKFGCLKRTIF